MNHGTGQQLSVSTVAAIRIDSLGLANDVRQTVPPISDDIHGEP